MSASGLLGELSGVGLSQPFKVLQLPAQAGELFQMRHAQQRPFGLCGDQRQQETALIGAQTMLEFAHHALARRQERIKLDGLGGHACEIVLELLADVAQRRKQLVSQFEI